MQTRSKAAATGGSGTGGPLYVTRLDGEVPPRVLESSLQEGALGAEPGTTMIEALRQAAAKWGSRNALAVKRVPPGGTVKDTPYSFITWSEYYQSSKQFARALLALGFKQHQCINVLGFNAPEWFFSFMGASMAGGSTAGIYTTNGPEACKYVTAHSGAVVVVAEDAGQVAKYAAIAKSDCPNLKAIVQYKGSVDKSLTLAHPGVTVYAWDEFMALGADDDEANKLEAELEARAQATRPGHCCSLIYTSGTTGPPKAVLLSHDNLTWSSKTISYFFPDQDENDSIVSYLPLSHVAAQVLDICLHLWCGGTVYFAQPDALKGSLIHTLLEVRPTIFFGVPRVWEKMYEAMQAVRRTTPLPMRLLSDYLKAQTLTWARSLQYGQTEVRPAALPVALKLFGKVKQKLGLDRAKYCATGAAPMPLEVQEYFASLGLLVFEVFGQSEGTGMTTLNCPKAFKLGTVGRPAPGLEVRFDPDNGEIQYRGRSIFMGYLGMEKETSEAVLEGGWLRSGDVATMDADHNPDVAKPSGFTRITGRIKELIITAGGENIPPVLIETEIKSALPAVANAMVVGDKRKFLVVLLTLHVDDEGRLVGPSKAAGQQMGSSASTVKEVQADTTWRAHLDAGIKAANQRATSRAQSVQKWALLPTDFSEKAGDLTPTLKLKRSVVADKYKDVIEALYK